MPYWIPLAVLLVPAALMAIGSWLFPETVWEGFVKKYYWDPIKNDEGYNFVNTASWAVLLGALMFLLYRVISDLDETMDVGLALAATPYMAGGSVLRVLEDTKMFGEPFRFALITPQIYVIITIIAGLFLLYGQHLRRVSRVLSVRTASLELAAAMGLVWIGYALLYVTEWRAIGSYANPLLLLGSLAVPYAYTARYAAHKKEMSPRGVMAAFGVAFLLFMSSYVLLWLTGEEWTATRGETHAWVLAAMVGFPLVIVVAQFFAARRLAPKVPGALVFAHPFNLLLVFAQMCDAAMTTIGIDSYGYQEKHVASGAAIGGMCRLSGADWVKVGDSYSCVTDGSEWFAFGASHPALLGFAPIKLLISLGVIWAIDLYAKDDSEKFPNLVGVAKLAIIVVGLSPGVRDAVRLAMGV